jgi:hypothetical protein
MKNMALLLCLAGCQTLAVGESDEATTGTTTPTPPPGLTLTLTSMEPAQPVENRPLFVRFRVQNNTPTGREGTVVLTAIDPNYQLVKRAVSVTLAPHQTLNGITEIMMWPQDLAQPYWLHYYDLGQSTPAEMNDCSGTLVSGVRAGFWFQDVIVNRGVVAVPPSDLTLQVDGYTNTLHNEQLATLPAVHAGTVQVPALMATVDFNLSYWTQVRFDAHLQWGGASLDLSSGPGQDGDPLPYYSPNLRHFGTSKGTLQADTAVKFLSAAEDTVPLDAYFAELHSGWGVTLATNGTGLSAQILTGGGTLYNVGGLTYVAPAVTVPTEVKLRVTDATRSATVYVRVLP